MEMIPDRRHALPAPWRTAGGVACRTFGTGVPLVLLHGGAGSWLHWVRTVDVLAERFQVHALDLPGFGDSADVGWEIPVETYLEAVVRAVDEIAGTAPAVHLTGFSFGGFLAAHVAVGLGARAGALSLIGSAGFGRPVERPFTLDSRRRLAERLGRTPTEAELGGMHRGNLAMLMIADPGRIDDWAVWMQGHNLDRARFDSRRVSWADGVPGMIGRLTCPVLVAYGEKDAAATPSIEARLERCRAARPDVETAVLPDCGHWAMYEAPEAANALLAGFHNRAAETDT